MKNLTLLNAILGVVNASLLTALVATPAVGQSVFNAFSFTPRTGVSSFPVASIRPVNAGTVAALDVMPSAGALPHPENGYAWIDACDADILAANGNVPVSCARIGIKPDRVEIGSRAFDGAPAKDTYIIRNHQVVGRFHAGGLEVFGVVRATGGFTN